MRCNENHCHVARRIFRTPLSYWTQHELRMHRQPQRYRRNRAHAPDQSKYNIHVRLWNWLRRMLLLWCRATEDDIGDRAMTEHSPLKPRWACWARVTFPRCKQTIQILQSNLTPFVLLPFILLVITKFSKHAFSRDASGKPAAVDGSFSCVRRIPASFIIRHYLSSPSMISSPSSSRTKIPLLSACPLSLLTFFKFCIHTTKPTRRNNAELVAV